MEAGNGKHVKALEIFTYAIHYLHKRALEVIRQRTGDEHFSSRDIQWVLTVPAIWKPAAKQFMREAAYKVKYSLTVLLWQAINSKSELISWSIRFGKLVRVWRWLTHKVVIKFIFVLSIKETGLFVPKKCWIGDEYINLHVKAETPCYMGETS